VKSSGGPSAARRTIAHPVPPALSRASGLPLMFPGIGKPPAELREGRGKFAGGHRRAPGRPEARIRAARRRTASLRSAGPIGTRSGSASSISPAMGHRKRPTRQKGERRRKPRALLPIQVLEDRRNETACSAGFHRNVTHWLLRRGGRSYSVIGNPQPSEGWSRGIERPGFP
jgi:hypothetical protein